MRKLCESKSDKINERERTRDGKRGRPRERERKEGRRQDTIAAGWEVNGVLDGRTPFEQVGLLMVSSMTQIWMSLGARARARERERARAREERRVKDSPGAEREEDRERQRDK